MIENENSTHRLSRRSFITQLMIACSAVFAGPALAIQRSLPKWDAKKELVIALTIASQQGRRVHRPYVAVWIEGEDGKMVRTLAAWIQQTGKGAKWYPDLTRWFRGATSLRESANIDLVTHSSATKSAGEYKLSWDGKDDANKLVNQGKYYVCIEAAREHGTYQLIRQQISIGSKPFKQDLTGNVEISSASIEYRQRPTS